MTPNAPECCFCSHKSSKNDCKWDLLFWFVLLFFSTGGCAIPRLLVQSGSPTIDASLNLQNQINQDRSDEPQAEILRPHYRC